VGLSQLHCDLKSYISPPTAVMMMIALVTIKSGLVPLIEGLCDQIFLHLSSGFAFTSFAKKNEGKTCC